MMKEKWRIGNHPSTVVSDTKQLNTNYPSPPNSTESDDSDIKYYGGYLVCESIGSIGQAKIIAAAPDLLECAKENLEFLRFIESRVKDFNLISDKRELLYKRIGETIIMISKATD